MKPSCLKDLKPDNRPRSAGIFDEFRHLGEPNALMVHPYLFTKLGRFRGSGSWQIYAPEFSSKFARGGRRAGQKLGGCRGRTATAISGDGPDLTEEAT